MTSDKTLDSMRRLGHIDLMIAMMFCLVLQDEPTAEKAEDLFVEAYKAYVAGDRESSTKSFTKIYDKFSKEQIGAIAAYNIACNFALDEENDKALEWLKKALDAGYSNFDHAESDGDLTGIRDDKKFEELISAAKKNAPKDKPAPIKEEDAKKFAEKLVKAHKDDDRETFQALSSRLGHFGHDKAVEWLNAELKKKAFKLADDGSGWRLVEIGD